MEWSSLFTMEQKPSSEEIKRFINTPLWEELCGFIEETYPVKPQIEYSKCSAAPGWNVKYKKGSRSICTLYPHEGYFTCLVSIGSKEAAEAELVLTGCDSYLQSLYQSVKPFNGARWLMIDVTAPAILDGVKQLIRVRVKPKK